jgi:tetratricopeptide (TPR) repeat protein
VLLLVLVAAACRQDRRGRAEWLADGQAHWDQQRFADSAASFERAVELDPTDGRARLKYAQALWRAGRFPEGAREAIRAADLLPDDDEAQRLAAARALSLQRYTEAEGRALRLLNAASGDVDAMLILGNAYAHLLDSTWALYFLRTKASRVESFEAALREVRPPPSAENDRRAEAVFRQALALAPQSFEARVALVNFLWAANRQDEATDMLRRLADDHVGHQVVAQALGAYYLSRNRWADAEVYLRRAAESGDRDAVLTLAAALDAGGRDVEALAVLERLPDEPPGSVFVTRAAIESRRGNHGEALRLVDDVLSRSPQQAGALITRSTVMAELRRSEDALKAAEAAVAAAPTSADAYFALGRARQVASQPDQALDAYSEAMRLNPLHMPAATARAFLAFDAGQTALAAELARTLRQAEPDDTELAVLSAAALVRSGDESAHAAVEQALARFPRSAKLLALRGDVLAARGRPGARDAYERALSMEPNLPEAVCGLASVDAESGAFAAATRRLEAAIARSPEHSRLIAALAGIQLRSGDPRSAMRTYQRLLEVEPGHVDGAIALARILESAQRGADALAVLTRLVERRPQAAAVRLALGAALERAGRGDEAARHYQLLLSSRTGVADAALRLAMLELERDGNLDVALDFARRAVQLRPEDARAGAVLGWIYVKKGLPASGLPSLEKSVRAEPRDPTVRYYLGLAYDALGRSAAARRELRRALELDPEFRFAAAARRSLIQSTP